MTEKPPYKREKPAWVRWANGEKDAFEKLRSRDSIVKKLTPKQIERRKQRRKPRKGETKEVWERRIRKYNLMSDAQIQRFLRGKRIHIYFHKLETKKEEKRLAIGRKKQIKINRDNTNISIYEKEFNFLKYYGLLSQLICIRYGIRKDDFEIMLYLYDGVLFNRERFFAVSEFTNVGCNPLTTFRRFVSEKYITNIKESKAVAREKNARRSSEVFKLNQILKRKIEDFYQMLAQKNSVCFRSGIKMCPPAMVEEIEAMNREVQAILNGDIPQLDFKF